MKRGEFRDIAIGIALLVVVLFIVLLSTGNLFGREISIFKLLPNFGNENKTVANLEIFRYDISNGNVMYYDGTNWNSFDGEIRAGDKKVNYNSIKKNFENHYYFTKRQSAFEIEQGVSLVSVLNLVNSYNNNNVIEIDKKLEDSSKFLGALNLKIYEVYVPNEIVSGYVKDLGLDFSHAGKGCEKCKIGDVRFQLVNRDMSRGSLISFVLNLDDSVNLYYIENNQFNKIAIKGDLLTRMFNYMKEWRNSVFSKPISINYMTNDGGEVTNSFCGQFSDNKYIIVDLSKGVDSDAKC